MTMTMTMTYVVAEATNPTDLAAIVSGYMRDGWEPTGGVCALVGAGWRLYAQALVKR